MKSMRLHRIVAASLCFVGAQAQAAEIPLIVPPECREKSFGPMWDLNNGGFLKGAEAENERRRRAGPFMWDTVRARPFTFKDERTAISFHVAKDGRHLAAVGKDGKTVWESDPFAEAKMCPYRSPHPVISALSIADEREIKALANNPRLRIVAKDRYIKVTFDSSQYGVMNERTGRFTFLGQN